MTYLFLDIQNVIKHMKNILILSILFYLFMKLMKKSNRSKISSFFLWCSRIHRKKITKIMIKYYKASILADDWNYFSKSGLKFYTNPMIIRENHAMLSSTMNHTNKSLTFKKSNNFIIKFLLFSRKHIYGLIRLMILFIKYKRRGSFRHQLLIHFDIMEFNKINFKFFANR